MKKHIKSAAIVAIIFIVAGNITFLTGPYTTYSYGTILLLCGLVPVLIAIVSGYGSRQGRPMPYSYNPKISVSEKHLREIKDMKSSTSLFAKCFAIGTLPIVIGLMLMHFF